MKLQVSRHKDPNPEPIITKSNSQEWEAGGVFNPAVILHNGIFHLLYRTYSKDLKYEGRRGDRPGFLLKNQTSSIGYAESTDGIHFQRSKQPIIFADERDPFGGEDPRIIRFKDRFWIFYTTIISSLDKKKIATGADEARLALASTKDFREIEKHGIIGPPNQSSKAGAIFTGFQGNKIALAITLNPDSASSRIVIRLYDSIEELLKNTESSWEQFLSSSDSRPILPISPWIYRGPELGAPPLKTRAGWLFIYSLEMMTDTWAIGAFLSSANNPNKVIGRLPGHLLQPATDYECQGNVPNITFPSGAVINNDQLYIYYGCADTSIGLATCCLEELLKNIRPI